jgi:hypothetical protein
VGRLVTRRHTLTLVGVAMYVVFLVTAPFEHHDLACHLKNPLHCTSCTSSVLGADPADPVVAGAVRLADVGAAIALQATSDGDLLTVRSSGRSPPAGS